ncbi:hypothetical protein Emed_004159 [Eimeria media]
MSVTFQDLEAASYSAGVLDFEAGFLGEWQAAGTLKSTLRSGDEGLGKSLPEGSASRASSAGLPWVPTPSPMLLSVSAGPSSMHTLLAMEPEAVTGNPNVEGLHAAKPTAPSSQDKPKITYWGVAVVAMLLVLAATAAPLRRSIVRSGQDLWRGRSGRVEEGMLPDAVREGLSQEFHDTDLTHVAPSLTLHAPRALQMSVLNKSFAGSRFQYPLPVAGEAVGWLSAENSAAARINSPSTQEPVRYWTDMDLGSQGSSGVAFDPLSKLEPQQAQYADDHSASGGPGMWLNVVHDLDFLDSQSNSPFSGSDSDYTTESGSGSSTPTSEAQSREWLASELRARVRLSTANSKARSSDNPRRLRSAAGKSATSPNKRRIVSPARDQHKGASARGSRRRGVEHEEVSGGSQRGLKRRALRRLRLNTPDAPHSESARSSNLVEGLRLVGQRQLNPGFYRVPKAPPNSPFDVESQTVHPQLGFFVNVHPTADTASHEGSVESALKPDCEGSTSQDAGAGEDGGITITVDLPSQVAALLEQDFDLKEEDQVED